MVERAFLKDLEIRSYPSVKRFVDKKSVGDKKDTWPQIFLTYEISKNSLKLLYTI